MPTDVQSAPIVYVTRDIERALGMFKKDNLFIVSNKTTLSNKILKNMGIEINDRILLIENQSLMDTAELLENPEAKKFINNLRGDIVVFKNTSRIEEICADNGWNLLNPPAKLAEKIENKITQVQWLEKLSKYLPDYQIAPTKDLKWNNQTQVLQWAHGHTGDGTFLIKTQSELSDLQKKFPARPARMMTFISGPSFTVNILVAKDIIIVGNVSYQITGLKPFTENIFSTIGNDWSLTHSLLSQNEISQIETMAKEIAEKMRTDGWKGLLGIDVIKDEERNNIYLIEINARQPASTTYESFLQSKNISQIKGSDVIQENNFYPSLAEMHIMALKNIPITSLNIEINDGAQIVQRITSQIEKTSGYISEEKIKLLETAGYQTIFYDNHEFNADLLRIQSLKGIMEGHNKLNIRGKEITKIISS